MRWPIVALILCCLLIGNPVVNFVAIVAAVFAFKVWGGYFEE